MNNRKNQPMMKTELKLPTTIPITIGRWQSNGTINPLITSDEQLRIVAGSEYLEAIRWCAIHMDTYKLAGLPEHVEAMVNHGGGYWSPSDTECTQTFIAYLEAKKTPRWKRQPPILTKAGKTAFTTAQLLAIAGNLHCNAQCQNLADLLECFHLMGGYNGFQVEKAVRQFSRFNGARYYNQDNCNNGSDAFEYTYGWEGSHVVYISCVFTYGAKIITPDGKHYQDLTPGVFKSLCRELGECTDADENDECEDDGVSVKWRLWWD